MSVSYYNSYEHMHMCICIYIYINVHLFNVVYLQYLYVFFRSGTLSCMFGTGRMGYMYIGSIARSYDYEESLVHPSKY